MILNANHPRSLVVHSRDASAVPFVMRSHASRLPTPARLPQLRAKGAQSYNDLNIELETEIQELQQQHIEVALHASLPPSLSVPVGWLVQTAVGAHWCTLDPGLGREFAQSPRDAPPHAWFSAGACLPWDGMGSRSHPPPTLHASPRAQALPLGVVDGGMAVAYKVHKKGHEADRWPLPECRISRRSHCPWCSRLPPAHTPDATPRGSLATVIVFAYLFAPQPASPPAPPPTAPRDCGPERREALLQQQRSQVPRRREQIHQGGPVDQIRPSPGRAHAAAREGPGRVARSWGWEGGRVAVRGGCGWKPEYATQRQHCVLQIAK